MEPADASKYVAIDPRFSLRGWLEQPYAVLDNLTGTAHFVSKEIFNTLQLCNGRFRASDVVFLGQRRAQLRQLEHEGVLAFAHEPLSLEPRQEYKTYPNHYMRQVTWSLTGRCNYRCRHCFMSAPHGALPQPSTEECLAIADQMAACGVQVVKLTGGECLIRNDFLQIVDRILAGGMQIATILSNGSLVTEQLLCALEERGVPRLAHGRVDTGDECAQRLACPSVRANMYIGPDGHILPCIPMSYDDALQRRFPDIAGMTLQEALTDSYYFRFIDTTVGDVLERNPKCQACAYRSRCLGGCRAKGVDEQGNPDPMGVDCSACRFYLGGYYDRARGVLERLTPRA